MKIIELLNKIANREETPKKFKYDNLTFEEFSYGIYRDNEGDYLDDSIGVDFSNLNDEIEIIEEDKKIEKMECNVESWFLPSQADIEIIKKLNEIIEVINNDKSK